MVGCRARSPAGGCEGDVWGMVECAEMVTGFSLCNRRRLRVSVVRSITCTCSSTLMDTGCVLAMPIRMANCVERTPEAGRGRGGRARVGVAAGDAGSRDGHAFNVGPGVSPDMSPDHVAALVDEVHLHSAR